MAKKTYYWIGPGVFGGGPDNTVKIGEKMPTDLTEKHLESLKKQGLISTEKTVTERQLSELERLQAKVKELEAGGGGKSETALKKKITELEADKETLQKEIAELTDPGSGDKK